MTPQKAAPLTQQLDDWMVPATQLIRINIVLLQPTTFDFNSN